MVLGAAVSPLYAECRVVGRRVVDRGVGVDRASWLLVVPSGCVWLLVVGCGSLLRLLVVAWSCLRWLVLVCGCLWLIDLTKARESDRLEDHQLLHP